jgi:hypothetical protein
MPQMPVVIENVIATASLPLFLVGQGIVTIESFREVRRILFSPYCNASTSASTWDSFSLIPFHFDVLERYETDNASQYSEVATTPSTLRDFFRSAIDAATPRRYRDILVEKITAVCQPIQWLDMTRI